MLFAFAVPICHSVQITKHIQRVQQGPTFLRAVRAIEVLDAVQNRGAGNLNAVPDFTFINFEESRLVQGFPV
jgi:hypothetical protein